MKLAPRMIQSMEILQLNMMALNERIEQELVEKRHSGTRRKGTGLRSGRIRCVRVLTADRRSRGERASQRRRKSRTGRRNDKNNESDFERLLEISSEWPEDNVSFGGGQRSANQISDDMDRQHDVMSNMMARPQSLHEYLLEQFSFFSIDHVQRQFGEYLIQHLDHNGRLQSMLPEIAQQFNRLYEHQLTNEQADEVLKMIQHLDPPALGLEIIVRCFCCRSMTTCHSMMWSKS